MDFFGGRLFILLTVVQLLGTSSAMADRLKFGSFVQNESNLPSSYSAVRSPQIPGSGKGHRFQIFGGKCFVANYRGQQEGDCTFNSVRSQLVERGNGGPKNTQPAAAWYGWDFFMPSEFPIGSSQVSGKYNYAQWKGANCPHVSFISRQDSPQLFLELMRTTGTNDCKSLALIPLVSLSAIKAKWTRFEVFARWSTGSDGQIVVFIDGKQSGTYSGPTLVAASHDGGPTKNHFDFGPYLCCTSGLPHIRPGTLYYANITRAAKREALWN